jgi:hypothetical protein
MESPQIWSGTIALISLSSIETPFVLCALPYGTTRIILSLLKRLLD